MKTYILQKHLPNLNAGSELTLSCDGERYEIQDDSTKHYFSLYKEVVENNPEWFKLKEIEIPTGLAVDLSNGSPKELQELLRLWRQFKPTVLEGDRKYTLQDMKDCFNAARVPAGGIGTYWVASMEYINHINSKK